MMYFSGFGLYNDCDSKDCIYREFLCSVISSYGLRLTQYDIVGFDSGAKFALDYALFRISNNLRVGKIILLSPVIPCLYEDICLDSLLDSKQDMQENDLITHVDYIHFMRLHKKTCFKEFSNICKENFYNNSYAYAKSVLEKYDYPPFQEKHSIESTITNNKSHWLEYLEKLLHKSNNLAFIARNCTLFMVFIAENDRMADSKITLDIFSRIGICLFIKNLGHSFL